MRRSRAVAELIEDMPRIVARAIELLESPDAAESIAREELRGLALELGRERDVALLAVHAALIFRELGVPAALIRAHRDAIAESLPQFLAAEQS